MFIGKNSESSLLVTRMESSVSDLVGEDYNVKFNDVHLNLTWKGKVKLDAENVTISKKSNDNVAAKIENIAIESNLSSALSGNGSFDVISLNGGNINTKVFGSGSAQLLPASFKEPLDALGKTLQTLQNKINSQGFKKLEVNNFVFNGALLGRLQEDPINLETLILEAVDNSKFQLTADVKTQHSSVNLQSAYFLDEDKIPSYEFSITGISLLEWLNNPDDEGGVIASDSDVDLIGRIRFRPDGSALDPILNLKVAEGVLRIGPREITEIKKIDLNFHLLLALNQIELDPSEIEVGRLKATLIGGIKPEDETAGYAGAILYDMIMQRGEFEPTIDGERVLPAGFKVAGLYNREKKTLDMNNIVLTTQFGAVQGTGSFGFTGETPSLKASGTTEGISVTALKQFWPFFIADGARNWVHTHIIEGDVVSGTLEADIPPGIIFRLKKGAKLKPEHFKTQLNVKNFAFHSFGNMPPIQNGVGTLTLEGMQIVAAMNDGVVIEGVSKPVKVISGKFVMDDFEAKKKIGNVNLSLSGEARSIAEISNRKPVSVMDRMKVDANQFSGQATADVAAIFPIRKSIEYDEVKWNVLLDLQNAASSKPIGDRKFSAANLVIDANPTSARVTGKTQIDGIKADVVFLEPIGNSGNVKSSRTVSMRLTNEELAKQDINLAPVVRGPITVSLKQQSGKESFEVNLTEANLSLPWVGWSKGKKIPAKANFDVVQKNGRYVLNNFKLNGSGFSAAGNLVLNKSGLISANMTRMSLNEGDDVQLKVALKNNIYEIIASGGSYDARGVMNTLIFDSNFSQAQGSRSVDLKAQFGRVVGFEGRSLLNANMRYQSSGGKLTFIDLQARDNANLLYEVQARRNNNQTNFIIRSGNAGNAFAFTNIYTRMQGGLLNANLVQSDNGPFLGPVQIRNFDVINEPRLANFASSVRSQTIDEGGTRRAIIPDDVEKRAKFSIAESRIEKGKGYLKIQDAIVRNPTIGLTASGLVYNADDQISLSGTFMPANIVNSVISQIPVLGALLSGRDNPFVGITYQLTGARANPQLIVNPLSIVAPGVFKKVFEFSN